MSQESAGDAARLKEGESPYAFGPTARRRLRWLGLALAIAALVYFVGALRQHSETLETIAWDGEAIAWLVMCLSTYLLAYAVGAGIWCLIMAALGRRVGFRAGLAICGVSQFAKYLPGNVAHYAGRVALASGRGLEVDHVIFSMLLETVNLILAGILAGGLLLFAGPDPAQSLISVWDWVPAMVIAMLIVIVAVSVPLWRRIRGRQTDASINLRLVPVCVGLQCGVFLLHGVIVALVASGILGLVHAPLAALTGIFAVAWISGFVIPGAPAGIGVRETVISLGLTPLYGASGAVAVAALLRVVSVLGDLLTLLAGLVLLRRAY